MQLPEPQGASISDPNKPFPYNSPLERGEPKSDGSCRAGAATEMIPPIPSSASAASQAAEGV